LFKNVFFNLEYIKSENGIIVIEYG
jgi:ssDNA-specific exonuclease RecJ